MKRLKIGRSLIVGYLPTSRPRFWIYLMGPYIIGVISWAADGTWTTLWSVFTLQVLLFLIYFSYPANLLVYGINDIYDYKTDILNPKKIEYESIVQPDQYRSLWVTILLLNIPFLFFTILPTGSAYLRLFIFIISSIIYSAPPLRAKAKPVVDTFISALIYVAPWVVWYTISWWESVHWMIVGAGIAWSMAMHAYSAIPDIQADSESSIDTVATLYWPSGTIRFCMTLYSIACILMIPTFHRWVIPLWLVYMSLMSASFFYPIGTLYRYFPLVNTLVWFLLFVMILSS